MEEKKQLLQKLINKNEKLKPIVFKSFDTEKELDVYTKNIQREVDEYYENQEQIEKLEWDLMTPEEQEQEKETLRLMKLKREGKLK